LVISKSGSASTLSPAFKNAIIAAGSQAVRLPFMPEDPRAVDSTGALELKEVPKRMLILGGGTIGLEMGTVYSTLRARLHLLKTKTVSARALPDGIEATFASMEEGDAGSNASVAAPAP
jgi:dihydrolipoamide dehydrogenase